MSNQSKPGILSKNGSMKKTLAVYLIMAPGLIYLIINNILPLYGLTIAFRNVSYRQGPLNSPFFDWPKLLSNFEMLFRQDIIGILVRNTLLYNLAFIVIDITIPVAVAILFNSIENASSRKFFQTAILLPNVISWVIISYIGYSLLSEKSGMLSHLFGITDFYHNPQYWPFILAFFHLWKGVGMGMVVYVAALVGIDPEMYEAAKIDGASWWTRTVRITLPMMRKMIVTMLILNLSKILSSDFGLFYQLPMNSSYLKGITQTLDVYVFSNLVGADPNIGLTAAVSSFQSVVGLALVLGANAAIKRIDKDSALF